MNVVDAIAGYTRFSISSTTVLGAIYNLFADVLSFLVLVGVVALVIREILPSIQTGFSFQREHSATSRRTERINQPRFVDCFRVHPFPCRQSRHGRGCGLAQLGPADLNRSLRRFRICLRSKTLMRGGFSDIGERWGVCFLFLAYFPYSKHVHIFMAPLKYFFARRSSSGVLPLVDSISI